MRRVLTNCTPSLWHGERRYACRRPIRRGAIANWVSAIRMGMCLCLGRRVRGREVRTQINDSRPLYFSQLEIARISLAAGARDQCDTGGSVERVADKAGASVGEAELGAAR